MITKLNEQFHDSLIAQYKELIHEALIESDHLDFLDEVLFNKKFNVILVSAKYDGLTSEDIMFLTEQAKREILDHRKAA